MQDIIYDSTKMKVPVKMWADEVEEGAMNQIMNLASLPFVFKQVAIMPDCHQGYGMPIGGVLATEGVVVPNAGGVDNGCGMCAVKTSIKAKQLDKEVLKKIMSKIREVIPLGMNHHKEKQNERLMPKYIAWDKSKYTGEDIEFHRDLKIVGREFESALKQIGTLGGGNHFIEIQKDNDDNIWIMIHSGSRNLGYKVAKYYNDLAIELNESWFSKVPKKWELAFLPLDSEEGQKYLLEMNYCVDFALVNRKLMMDRIIDIIFNIADTIPAIHPYYCCDIKGNVGNPEDVMINIAHNYARMEHHFGRDVIIHRKGATLARKDTIGIIPGSQGTKSYIVKGLGNKESFESCSHGAGRLLGRKEAQKTLNLEVEIKKMEDKGIVHSIRNIKDLDEASGAYKPIDEVMRNQSDLVEILVELQPLGAIKG
jgi:tRNA-splicing ligase RtcB